MSRYLILLLAFAAGLLNVVPWMVSKPGSDVFFHYALIECFSRQFWQGDFYPRWCMDGNTGLGAPDLLYYFPFSYYIAALLEPLRYLGLTTEQIYVCSLALAGMVTFLTCRLWLAEIVGPNIALLTAFLFLWMPYRTELLLFRSAYAEVWGLAFLPLLLLYVRRMVKGMCKNIYACAALIALCLLTHVPATLIILFGCGLYCLLLSPRALLPLFISTLVALLLIGPYIGPALYFMDALNPAALEESRYVWANSFVSLDNIAPRMRAMVAAIFLVLMAIGLAAAVLLKRTRITNDFVRRETMAWCGMAVLALFMSFNISAPLWTVFRPIAMVVTPWRMRLIILFAAVFLFAVRAKWQMSPKQHKTWKYDYALAAAFLVLMGLFVMMSRVDGDTALTEMQRARILTVVEYKPRATDAAHTSTAYFLSQLADPDKGRHVWVSGSGNVQETQWDDKGIAFTAELPVPVTVHTRQWYFPIWHARIDGKSAPLSAESGTGDVLINLPAGRHTALLYRDLGETWPLYGWLKMLSVLTGIMLLAGYISHRRRALLSR